MNAKFLGALALLVLLAASGYYFMSLPSNEPATANQEMPASGLPSPSPTPVSRPSASPTSANSADVEINAAIADIIGNAELEGSQASSENGTEGAAELTNSTNGAVYAE